MDKRKINGVIKEGKHGRDEGTTGEQMEAETGEEMRAKMGAKVGIETGAKAGMETGAETGAETGVEVGADMGEEMRAETGANVAGVQTEADMGEEMRAEMEANMKGVQTEAEMRTKTGIVWTKEGHAASLYVLRNKKGTVAEITDLGATLVRLWVRDKEGRPTDVVMGYDTPKEYEQGAYFFGTVVGRNANRIGGAQFELNQRTYTLADNDNGNNLHSGTDFYYTRIWETEEYGEDYVRFKLHSPDGDQGFPGNADIYVTYRLDETDMLDVRYEASADRDTLFNLTNHSYFNLDGHDSGSVLGHVLQLEADCFTPGNAHAIPTGEILPVEGTPMDFRKGGRLEARIEEEYEPLRFGNGYDHNWVLKNQGKFEKIGELCGEKSGIRMEVFTDRPGVQIYTANYVEEEKGKDGAVYGKRGAVCLETQCIPDAVHHAHFPSPICRAGEKYDTHTAFRFSVEKDS